MAEKARHCGQGRAKVDDNFMSEPVEIPNCSCTIETDAAILVDGDEFEEAIWIPKSQITAFLYVRNVYNC